MTISIPAAVAKEPLRALTDANTLALAGGVLLGLAAGRMISDAAPGVFGASDAPRILPRAALDVGVGVAGLFATQAGGIVRPLGFGVMLGAVISLIDKAAFAVGVEVL